MSALEVRGLEETSARFDAYPAALQAALGAKATELARRSPIWSKTTSFPAPC